jgi:putative transposase
MLYHLVCPVKFQKKIFTEAVAQTLKQVCMEIGQRYEIYIVEIGTDEDHVHFLTQSVPMMLPTRMVQTIKSITAKQVLDKHPEIQKILWGGKFWTSGYYINTVGAYGNEVVIANYVKNQGKTYEQIHRDQLMIFEGIE